MMKQPRKTSPGGAPSGAAAGAPNNAPTEQKNPLPDAAPALQGGQPLSEIAAPLVAWYREHARPLPWRQQKSAYHVWLSEVMLQQTRIEAVRGYYDRFLAAAPDIPSLAALSDDRLMKLWEGLGYYSRARNLRRAAVVLCESYGGEMPRDYAAIRALPGIGDYTAGAIASIAFGMPYPAPDGNVARVLTRLTGDRADILRQDTKKRLRESLMPLYREATAPVTPAALTEGLMELGETVCIPNGTPRCDLCPLFNLCRARAEGSWGEIPVRQKKTKRRTVHKLVLLLREEDGRFAIRRRPEDGLLAGLWELPNIDLPERESAEACDALARSFCRENGLRAAEGAVLEDARHIFTHLEWQMQGYYLNVTYTAPAGETELCFATPAELHTAYALPSAFRAFCRVIFGET